MSLFPLHRTKGRCCFVSFVGDAFFTPFFMSGFGCPL